MSPYLRTLLYVKLLFTICALVSGTKESDNVRKTLYGNVQGYDTEVLPDRTVQIFLGVPYAAEPTGELRFEYPQEPHPWEGILNTKQISSACMQRGDAYIRRHFTEHITISENCLYMNIYVPKTNKKNMEVLLWIHGGSNEVGMGAMLTGEVLAAYGEIVVVNFNYRLSHLGFLNFDHEDFPGNFGIADQRAAMHWVQRNIHFFDGDPKKVTLAGHSAGGLDVSLHMISNATKGLFRYVIQMSGTSLGYWSSMTPRFESGYRTEARDFIAKLNCEFKDVQRIKTCLRGKTPYELTHREWKNWQLIQHPITVDKTLVQERPATVLMKGRAQVLPVMLGFTKDEGGIQAENYYLKKGHGLTKADLLKQLSIYSKFTEDIKGFAELVFHEYAYYPDPTNVQNMIKTYSHVEGDLAMVVPTLQTARYLYEQYSKQNFSHIYLYNFEYMSPKVFNDTPWVTGTPHGRDLFYLFGLPLIGHSNYNFTSTDRVMSETMMDVWISFIRNGYPSYTKQNIERFRTFDPVEQALTTFTNKNEDEISIQTEYKHRLKQFDFWTQVIPALAETPPMTSECGVFHDALCKLCMTLLFVCMVRILQLQ